VIYPEAFERWYERHSLLRRQEAYEQWLREEYDAKRSRRKKKGKKAKPKKVNYHEYIRSQDWINKSRKWRKKTKACEKCGSAKELQCHHKHYRTLGRERREDILVVCRTCHCKLHGVEEFVDKTQKPSA
jgi:hypothetical protein